MWHLFSIISYFFLLEEVMWSIVSQISDQLYRPPVEIAKSCCRPVRQGHHRNNSPRFYVSFVGNDHEEGKKPETKEPHVVIQMDTESPVIYQKKCLEYYFDKPVVVSSISAFFYPALCEQYAH